MIDNTKNHNRYLLDSNIFIVAKKNYYNPDIVPAFWQWLLEGNKKDYFYSIDIVSNELKKGKDEDYLHQFAIQNQDFFVSSNEINCIAEYGKLQAWANLVWTKNKPPNKTNKAIEAFASATKADAFLVAYAKANNFILVTNETSEMQSQTNVKIPDAANSCGVKIMNLYDLLLMHSHKNFQFK